MNVSEEVMEARRRGGSRVWVGVLASALFGLVQGPILAGEGPADVEGPSGADGDTTPRVEPAEQVAEEVPVESIDGPTTGLERFAWKGLVPTAGSGEARVWGVDPTLGSEEGRAERLRHRLADLRLSFQVQRRPEAALEGLAEVRKHATHGEFDGQLDLLIECALQRSAWLEMSGKSEAATAALGALWFDPSELGGEPDPRSFEPIGGARLRAERAALGSVELVTARAERSGDSGQDGADDDVILAHVREALGSGGSELLSGLGRSALPALRALSIEAPNALPGVLKEDPVYHYVRLAELEAATFLLAHFDDGGPFWHKRIVRAISSANVLENPGTWEGQFQVLPDKVFAPVLQEPEWRPLLARLMGDPTTVEDTLELVRILALSNALDESLRQGLFEAAHSEDPDARAKALDVIMMGAGWNSMKPIFERFLASEESELRELAVEGLLKYADPGTLASQIAHGDPKVRAGYARSLLTRQVPIQYSVGHQAVTQQYIKHKVEPTSEAKAAARRLLVDPAPEVRRIALNVANYYREDFGWTEAEVTRLCTDEDVEVRMAAVWISVPDLGILGPGLEALSKDPDPRVLGALDSCLQRVQWHREGAERLGPAVERRWWDEEHPFLSGRFEGQGPRFVMDLMHCSEVFAPMLERAAKEGDERMLEPAYSRLGSSSYGSLAALLGELGPQRGTALVQRMRELHGDGSWPVDGVQHFVHSSAVYGDDPAADRALDTLAHWIETQALSLEIRSHGLGQCLRARHPRAAELFATFVAEDAEFAALEDPVALIADVHLHRPEDQLSSRQFEVLAQSLLGTEGVDPGVLDILFDRWVEVLEPATQARLLERASRDPEQMNSVGKGAINALRRDPEHLPDSRLSSLGELPPLTRSVLSVIGTRRSEGWEAEVARFLDPTWIDAPENPDDGSSLHTQVVAQAMALLGGATSDAAAKELLRGLDVIRNPKLRTQCRELLAQLRARREEKRLWERHFAGVEERETGIQRLLLLLGDESTELRIEAIRALATMGVVDAMPKLVDLLRDPDASVRTEARAALDKLNRSNEEESEPSDG